MFSNFIFLFCLFEYSWLFSNSTQCSRMLSTQTVLKLPLISTISATYWHYIVLRKELFIFYHSATSGNDPSAVVRMVGGCRPRGPRHLYPLPVMLSFATSVKHSHISSLSFGTIFIIITCDVTSKWPQPLSRIIYIGGRCGINIITIQCLAVHGILPNLKLSAL